MLTLLTIGIITAPGAIGFAMIAYQQYKDKGITPTELVTDTAPINAKKVN